MQAIKKKQGFEKQLRQNQNLAGLINVDKALYKHWLVQSTVGLRLCLHHVTKKQTFALT